jgi:hypothetical protein
MPLLQPQKTGTCSSCLAPPPPPPRRPSPPTARHHLIHTCLVVWIGSKPLHQQKAVYIFIPYGMKLAHFKNSNKFSYQKVSVSYHRQHFHTYGNNFIPTHVVSYRQQYVFHTKKIEFHAIINIFIRMKKFNT